jgi:hypothetical protein
VDGEFNYSSHCQLTNAVGQHLEMRIERLPVLLCVEHSSGVFLGTSRGRLGSPKSVAECFDTSLPVLALVREEGLIAPTVHRGSCQSRAIAGDSDALRVQILGWTRARVRRGRRFESPPAWPFWG